MTVRRRRGWIAVGLVSLLIGAYFLYSYNPAHSFQSTFNVLPNRYFKILSNLRDATRVTGTFTELNGRPVAFMIMSSAQFSAFQASNVTANVYTLSPTGRGTVDWSSTVPDAYYMVFRHGSGYVNTTQTVTFARTYTSLDEIAVFAGIALLVLGAVEIYWGLYPAGRRAARTPETVSEAPPPPWP
ncbi:MAG TPA: hypothetical protein VFA17_03825 [Thermoplasmata archaeon]|jgi:hypothetical protein|nr:hypothetical protein [Thermoplasmata archaeon]